MRLIMKDIIGTDRVDLPAMVAIIGDQLQDVRDRVVRVSDVGRSGGGVGVM